MKKNMIEIKFRAWDKKNKIMLNNVSTGTIMVFDKTNHRCAESITCIFQQFTGLLDKNGKEIYEGDIVKYDYGNPLKREVPDPKIREIIFINGQFCLKNDTNHYELPPNTPLYYKANNCEVIGNIFKNPGLINN